MSRENLSVVLHGINDLRLENRPIPEPNDDQALLQMEVVGICGSDVHYWVAGRIGPFIVKDPMIIGHEASGTVVKVGKNVKNVKPGDRVAIEPGVSCRKCTYCKTGKYNLCPDMIFCATPPVDGNLSRYYVHDADFLFKLPDHVSLEEGAMLEPLSVGVHACKQARVSFGSTVFVSGAGPIGLVTLLAAKAFGAIRVVITDFMEDRLKIAKQIGADYVVVLKKGESEESLLERIKEGFGGEQPSVSIDCSGAEPSVRICMQVTRSGGTMVLVGLSGKDNVNIPLSDSLIREIDIRGVFRYCNDYQTSLDMIASGKVDVNPLITHHFRMEDSIKAFETSKTGAGNAIKVLIHANPKWKP